MKKKYSFLFAALFAAISLYAQSGSFDSTFGTNGRFWTQYIYHNDMELTADGKIIIAGGVGLSNSTQGRLVKLTANGTMDTTFGNEGRVGLTYGTICTFNSIEIQPDGKIVVGGSSEIDNIKRIIVARFLPDGALDTSFGDAGVRVISEITNSNGTLDCVKLQPDGRILYSGVTNNKFLIGRLLANGLADESFNGTGYNLLTDIGTSEAFDVSLFHADNKILASGRNYYNLMSVKFNEDGTIDTTFGQEGFIRTMPDTGPSLVYKTVMLENDDFFWAAAATNLEIIRYNSYIYKFDSNGNPITSFGNNGFVKNDFGGNIASFTTDIAVKGNSLVALLAKGLPTNYHYCVKVFDLNGVPDTTFANQGQQDFSFVDGSTSHEYAKNVLIQPDGKILAGGVPVSGNGGVARLMPNTALSSKAFNMPMACSLYPNPVKDVCELQFNLKEKSAVTATLYDMRGIKVSEVYNGIMSSGDNKQVVNMAAYQQGVYNLVLQVNNEVVKTFKVVR